MSWTVCIVLSSFFSFHEVDLHAPDIPHLDKVVHFIFYLGFAALLGLACRELGLIEIVTPGERVKIFLFTVLFGTFIEVLQWTLTTWRSGDFLDAVANSLGALAGTAFLWYYRGPKHRPDWKN